MNSLKIDEFYIIGISVRTTNENGKSMQDIPNLWTRFISEKIAEQIPNKTDNSIYCIYTNYEQDHTQAYTTIVGCRVSNLSTIPQDMTSKVIGNTIYEKRTAIGNIHSGSVYNEWVKIWNSDIDRAYTADFEIYGEKALDPEHAEVDIYIAIN